jgi:aspartate racemase
VRTIGLIGGMSWESTALYYRLINQTVKDLLGGLHSAPIVLISLDFAGIEQLQREGRWDAAGALLAQSARSLAAAGAESVVLCTNTMHKVAPAIEAAVELPLLHIADPTGTALLASGATTVALLGTRFTMADPFYRDRLTDRFGLTVLTPSAEEQDILHAIIYDELCLGTVRDESRTAVVAMIDRLAERGAQAVILGCTEICLLVGPQDAGIPVFDTTELHARAAAIAALAEDARSG